jgi:hypothetical protein
MIHTSKEKEEKYLETPSNARASERIRKGNKKELAENQKSLSDEKDMRRKNHQSMRIRNNHCQPSLQYTDAVSKSRSYHILEDQVLIVQVSL